MEKQKNNKVIIYDDNCPLCKAYTKAFVNAGMLEKENRVAFSKIHACDFNLDWQRARHEIPLIDTNTNEVRYGVDALVELLQKKFCFIKSLMKIKFINSFFRWLYKLVSYNRKIIVAKTNLTKGEIDCTPDYSFAWRWKLNCICFIISFCFMSMTLKILNNAIFTSDVKYFFETFLFIIFCFAIAQSKKTATEIFTHASIICVIISVLLLITALVKKIFFLELLFFYPALICITIILLLQIKKRFVFMRNDGIV